MPTGSRVQLRFYGEVGALTLTETVSARTDAAASLGTHAGFRYHCKAAPSRSTARAAQAGPSPPPAMRRPASRAKGEVTREADGRLKLPFTAQDDYGVTGGKAVITLDLAAIDRRYGLAAGPRTADPITLDLPLPISGSRADFTETLVDDLSKHVFANLPVTITLSVTDARGQTGQAAPCKSPCPANASSTRWPPP